MSNFISRKLFLCATIGASFVSLISSCQDEDFGYVADEIKYAKNFKQVYGEIPADKSWDLSSYANWVDPTLSANTRSAMSPVPTRGALPESYFAVGENYYTVPKDLLAWLDGHLVEGNDNRFLGSSFVLKVPDNDFAIIPIYQGNSSIMSDFEVKINDYDITKVWRKSDNMRAMKTASSSWQQVGYWDGYSDYRGVDQTKVYSDEKIDGTDKNGSFYYKPSATLFPASTIGAYAIQSKPIIFKKQTNPSAGTFMYFSLKNIAKNPVPQGREGHYEGDKWVVDRYKIENDKIVTKAWDENDTWTTVGDRLTSIHGDGYMLALNVPYDKRPDPAALANLLPNYSVETSGAPQVMIIGCEDANGASTDHDLNDIVFLLVGYPNVPTVVPTTQVIKKRYMCEDLGATLDFDFNDIVIDVTQTTEYKIKTVSDAPIDVFFNDTKDPSTSPGVEIQEMVQQGEPVQTARIAHVCGTLPIQARVGNYLFPWINDPTDLVQTREELRQGGWIYNEETKVWSPATREATAVTRAAKYDVLEDGWNPNETRYVTGWKPNENNVVVYVQWPDNWQSPTSKDHPVSDAGEKWTYSNPYMTPDNEDQTIYGGPAKKYFLDLVQKDHHIEPATFPAKGSIPYMIAVDQDVPWMKECQDIPRSWLNAGEFDLTDKTGIIAGPGSGAYYEDFNTETQHAVIWTGRVTGEKGVTGVVLKQGSAEHAGLLEAFGDQLQYNTITVTTDAVLTSGSIGLCIVNGDGEWLPLVAGDDADGYSVDENGNTCAIIRLTPEQISAIKTHDFVVQSRTNGLVIRQISVNKVDGYDIYLQDPALDQGHVAGLILANDRDRDRDYFATGGRIPFAHAMYRENESVKLTAIAAAGYEFVNWSIDGVSVDVNNSNICTISKEHNPTTSSNRLTATFRFAVPTTTANLDADKYHLWSDFKADAHISNLTPSVNQEVYGDLSVSGEMYADLTNSKALVVEAKDDVHLRFLFNRQSLDNTSDDFLVINSSTSKDFIVTHDEDGNRTFIVDLDAIKTKYGYAHLNAIKIVSGSKTDVESMRLVSYSCPAESEYTTITEPLFDSAKDKVTLSVENFWKWNEFSPSANIEGAGDRVDKQGQKVSATVEGYCSTILGSYANTRLVHADLQKTDVMVIQVPHKGADNEWKPYGYDAPRLFFNRGMAEAIDFLASDTRYCRIYKDQYSNSYYYIVDLKKVRAAKTYSLLCCITTNYSGYSKVAQVWLDKYEVAAEEAYNTTYTVSLSTSDNDYEYYIGGIAQSTASFKPGETVTLKAKKAGTVSDYHFMWTGVSDIPDSGEDEEVSFTMPNEDVTITNTVLYLTYPATQYFKGGYKNEDGNYEGKNLGGIADVTMAWNGREVTNGGIYVPLGASVTATVTPKTGYTFKYWRWNWDTSTSRTDTRSSTDKKASWLQHAVLVSTTELTIHQQVDNQYFKTDYIDGVDIWNFLNDGKDYSGGIKFTIVISTGITDFYLMNEEGHANREKYPAVEGGYQLQVKGDSWINDASFNDGTREMTYILSATDFDTYFKTPWSHFYFGGNAPHATKVSIEVN